MQTRTVPDRVVIGLIIILLGIVFLLDTTDLLKTGGARWWPSAFILWGLWRLLSTGFREVTGPLILIAVAAFVLALTLGVDTGKFWPILLILVGVLVLVGGTRARSHARELSGPDDVNLVAVVGGVERKVTSQGFRGGQITAVMGGVDLDLRETKVAEAPATLDITAIMGGVEIRVPSDWSVRVDAAAILGGSGDERKHVEPVATQGPPHLVVTGLALLGGISIKS